MDILNRLKSSLKKLFSIFRKKQAKKAEDFKIEEKKEIKKPKVESYKHLIKPVDTEKTRNFSINNQYVFEVYPKSNKVEIKKAIESLYGVKPLKVNIVKMRGKLVRFGRRFGKMKNWKKAIVSLREGDKIDVYEGV